MANATIQQEFDIPAEQLWELIGDFGNMSKWTGLPPETCIQEGEGIGCIRTLTVPRGTIIDRLDALTANSYSYTVINAPESPLPYSAYSASMTVDAVTPMSSRLTWAGKFAPDGISEEEAVTNAENMYKMGIGMMKATIAGVQ
ncbi:MAG: SRPBCC family protein [Pseudomonadota bacterium]